MDSKLRCQSCGMPLGDGFYGTNSDASLAVDYCKFCFLKGEFTDPDLKLEDMLDMSIKNMKEDLNMPEDEATRLANESIPKLKRWQGG